MMHGQTQIKFAVVPDGIIYSVDMWFRHLLLGQG